MPIIGIITRKSISEEKHNIHIIYDSIINAINRYCCIPIGIYLDKNYKDVLNICDGVIYEGGDDLEEYELESLKYLYDNNKPVLCICMGMQSMGLLFNGELIEIKNHKKKLNYAHEIYINRYSKIYNILKKDTIKVNSRHNYVVKNPKLKVSAISNDGYIEAIEDSSKKFFIGVQWHPESMIDYSDIQNKIFEEFVKSCN